MSMSEFNPVGAWRTWVPANLLEESSLPTEPQLPVSDEISPLSEEHIQLELNRCREQAKKQGFAEGQAQGHEEGRAQGFQEGLLQGQQQGAEQALSEARERQEQINGRLSQLIDGFEEALNQLDRVIPARLMQLALTAARSIVGKQIQCDHSILLENIQQLLAKEPLFKGDIHLWVSASQLATVQSEFGVLLESRGWTLHGDEALSPGGCRISAEEGELDASIDTRWQQLCELSRED